MSIYRGYTLTIQVQGAAPQCLEGFSLDESVGMLDSIGSDVRWRESRANLQSYDLTLRGADRGAYAVLRGHKRAKTLITWTLQSPDLVFTQTGTGYVIAVARNHAPVGEETFEVTIQGYNNPSDV